MMTVLDEYTRQALAVTVRSLMRADDVPEALYPLSLRHGTPEYIRSDNEPEFIAQAMQDWLARVYIKPIRMYPGLPWETGYTSASTEPLAARCSMQMGSRRLRRHRSSSTTGSNTTIASVYISPCACGHRCQKL